MTIAVMIMACMPMILFAQMMDPSVPADEIFNLHAYFGTLVAFSGIIIPATSFVNKWIRLTGFWKQALSWIVSLALGWLAWWLNLGIFADLIWYWVIIYCMLGALVANGLFDITWVQALLRLIKLEKRKQ